MKVASAKPSNVVTEFGVGTETDGNEQLSLIPIDDKVQVALQ
jgi:hypothetical protein